MPRLSPLFASAGLALALASHHAPAAAGRSCESKALTAQDRTDEAAAFAAEHNLAADWLEYDDADDVAYLLDPDD